MGALRSSPSCRTLATRNATSHLPGLNQLCGIVIKMADVPPKSVVTILSIGLKLSNGSRESLVQITTYLVNLEATGNLN